MSDLTNTPAALETMTAGALRAALRSAACAYLSMPIGPDRRAVILPYDPARLRDRLALWADHEPVVAYVEGGAVWIGTGL